MKSLILSKFSMTYLPVFACLLFVALFIGMVYWVSRPQSKKLYQHISQLPLEEGETHEQR